MTSHSRALAVFACVLLTLACSKERTATPTQPTQPTTPSAGRPDAPAPAATLPAAPPTEVLTSRACGDDKSREGLRLSSIYFTNVSGEGRLIYWVDYDGQRRLYKTLSDRESYEQPTYVTHPWLVTNPAGGCLGIYLPSDAPTSVVLPAVGRTSPELTARNCADEPTLRSVPSTSATTIEFVNNTVASIRLYWRDFDGRRVFYQTLPPATRVIQPTFLTHPWVVTDTGDQCKTIFLPEASPGTATIR